MEGDDGGDAIKDDALAAAAEAIEVRHELQAGERRAAIRAAIEGYTTPASAPTRHSDSSRGISLGSNRSNSRIVAATWTCRPGTFGESRMTAPSGVTMYTPLSMSQAIGMACFTLEIAMATRTSRAVNGMNSTDIPCTAAPSSAIDELELPPLDERRPLEERDEIGRGGESNDAGDFCWIGRTQPALCSARPPVGHDREAQDRHEHGDHECQEH